METEKREMVANDILDKIVAATMCRHAKMSKEEYFACLSIEGDGDEEAEVRKRILALIQANTRQILALNNRLELIDKTLEIIGKEKNKDGEH